MKSKIEQVLEATERVRVAQAEYEAAKGALAALIGEPVEALGDVGEHAPRAARPKPKPADVRDIKHGEKVLELLKSRRNLWRITELERESSLDGRTLQTVLEQLKERGLVQQGFQQRWMVSRGV